MFTVFLFYKEKELFTGKGCVEMDIPWLIAQRSKVPGQKRDRPFIILTFLIKWPHIIFWHNDVVTCYYDVIREKDYGMWDSRVVSIKDSQGWNAGGKL